MVAIGVLWPSYSMKIKKNNLKNERAQSVSIDFHYPATYSFVRLEFLTMKVAIRRFPF